MSTTNNSIPEQHKFKQICDELNLPCRFIEEIYGYTCGFDDVSNYTNRVTNETNGRTGPCVPSERTEYSGWVVNPHSIENFQYKSSHGEYAIYMGYIGYPECQANNDTKYWNYANSQIMRRFLHINGIDYICKVANDNYCVNNIYRLTPEGIQYMKLNKMPITDEYVNKLFNLYKYNKDGIIYSSKNNKCVKCETVDDTHLDCECFETIIYGKQLFKQISDNYQIKDIRKNMVYFKVNKEFFDTIIVDRFKKYVDDGAFNIDEERKSRIIKKIKNLNNCMLLNFDKEMKDTDYKRKMSNIIEIRENKEETRVRLENYLNSISGEKDIFGG